MRRWLNEPRDWCHRELWRLSKRMGNNETKLRRKYLFVCLVGGYNSAIITMGITYLKYFLIKIPKIRKKVKGFDREERRREYVR